MPQLMTAEKKFLWLQGVVDKTVKIEALIVMGDLNVRVRRNKQE